METIEQKAVLHDVPPYLRVYKDGTIDRFLGTGIAPPSLDPVTGVSSKDVVFHPETGVSVRLYLPPNHHHHQKLPLVIYFHGGAFCISSTADPLYHNMLNLLVKQAHVILVSVDYRLAPETPLPAAYHDSYAALEWVAAHASGGDGDETWLTEFADFNRVFLAGDSAGANISHHTAIRVGSDPGRVGLKILGILMVHPYFWGEEGIGAELENPVFKGVVDQWWRFVCPSGRGCDDPWINPFVDGAPGVAGLGCGRMLVCVAGNDILRERGKLYYENVVKSGSGGKVEYWETLGEDHVFHIIDPTTQNSTELIKRCADFINS